MQAAIGCQRARASLSRTLARVATSEKRPEGRWYLDEAEVTEGVDEEANGKVLLWFRHTPTGLMALARIPGRHEESERELKPLLLAELEEKVAWKLRIPGRKWDEAGADEMPEGFSQGE